MVTITSGLRIADQPNLRVYSPEGQYADADLILLSDAADLATPVAMLQAQFVKYGPVVYQFNTPEDLGKAVLAIDPTSTLDAVVLYQQQEARDAARTAGVLTPSDAIPTTPPAPDTTSTSTTPTVDTPTTTSTSTPNTTTSSSSPADIILQDQQTIQEDAEILNVLKSHPDPVLPTTDIPNSVSTTTPSVATSTTSVDSAPSVATTTDGVASSTSP